MTQPAQPTTINIKGAREHNLKNIDLSIPKNKLVVFTGLSGSGKTSLAFDTLYAEGQRRYVESLSSYARQFLGIMHKPDVDQIEGLSPAISIDQKTTSHNPRSTVGTITEIYDYLRLLFARIGHPHCHQCGREISTQSIDQIIGHVLEDLENETVSGPARFMILAPVVQNRKGEFSGIMQNLQKKGYTRARIDGEVFDLNESLTLIKTNKHDVEAVIDRISFSKVKLSDDLELRTLKGRLSQSIEAALKLYSGLVMISWVKYQSLSFPNKPKEMHDRMFSENLACSHCGISIAELEPRAFSFNSPEGACPVCTGLGSLLKINPEKIVAPTLTLSEGAIIPFARMMGNDTWWARLVEMVIAQSGYDFHKTAFEDMSEEFQKVLLYGSNKVYTVVGENRFGKETSIDKQFEGFITNLERRYQETDSDFIRKEIEQFMLRETCSACHGNRLKPESLAVTITEKSIADITNLTIHRSFTWIEKLMTDSNSVLSPKERTISAPICKEIKSRLEFLNSVGLNYLTLSREASTLAGGEAQRIRLASQIGTGLTGVLYILDEPTIGLHPRDNHRLIATLENLRDQGNSVIVVEHDRDVMLAADYLVDFGPKAGVGGGKVVAAGTPQAVMDNAQSLTGKYLARKKDVTRQKTSRKNNPATLSEPIYIDPDEVPKTPSQSSNIQLYGAAEHNLKSIDVSFPLGTFTCITGISGSGKSTLLHDTLYRHLAKHLGKNLDDLPGKVERVVIPDEIKRVCLIDQSPIGKTPRSNPATYTKIFDYVRKIFATTKEAHIRGYQPGRFSFNVKGGRCEACQGDGQLKIEMQFLPDVYVVCDVCHGKRYNEETLQVTYQDKNIAEVLDLSIDQAHEFFTRHSTIKNKLATLIDVGLGYLKLGQPAPTLSGGEAQRVKLAKELSVQTKDHVVYLLDEPTTGLHFADVQKLLDVLHQLVNHNNTVIVIEHNLDVIKNADWILDIGPEGGEYGGELIAQGSPLEISRVAQSFTGSFLKAELAA